MTAVLDRLSEDELAALVTGEDDTARAEAMAEVDWREAAEDAAEAKLQRKRTAARYAAGTVAAEWYEATYADYRNAEDHCRGGLLSRAGEAAHVEPFTLWAGREDWAMRMASEELRNWWLEHPRVTVTEYERQVSAGRRAQREEWEAERREAGALKGTERKDMGAIYTGIRLAQAASRHPGGQGMSHEEYQKRTAATRERIATQAAVKAVRSQAQRQAHQAVATREPSEAAQPVTGTVTTPAPRQMPDAPLLLRRLLEEIGLLLTDYVEFPSRAAVIAVVLWITQAAARDSDGQPVWRAFPRLLLTSRENGSGKSTVGDFIAELLQCRAGRMSKVTAYGLTKVFGGLKETAIADDAQNVFRSDKAGAELLSILINGYSQKATWVSGKNDGKVEKAAGQAVIIGKDELLTKRGEYLKDLFARSVIVRMERPDRYMAEVDEEADDRTETLARALKAITGALLPQLREASRELAAENRGQLITDGDGGRTAQIRRPLLGVARVAGGRWPEAAQDAMAELAAASGDLLAAEEALEADTLAAARASLSGAGRAFWDDEIQP